MKTYKMYSTSINERYIDELVDTLRKGGVVGDIPLIRCMP